MSFDRFLMAVESRDQVKSSWQEYYKSVFFQLYKTSFLNDKSYSYTKKNYLALGNLATNQLNICKFLPPQIRKTLISY